MSCAGLQVGAGLPWAGRLHGGRGGRQLGCVPVHGGARAQARACARSIGRHELEEAILRLACLWRVRWSRCDVEKQFKLPAEAIPAAAFDLHSPSLLNAAWLYRVRTH